MEQDVDPEIESDEFDKTSQHYLAYLNEKHGFAISGDTFEEAEIIHYKMIFKP